jgi:hypothetical protein
MAGLALASWPVICVMSTDAINRCQPRQARNGL